MMADEIDERARTLDEFLADQIKRLIDDMEECREIFRVALKKLAKSCVIRFNPNILKIIYRNLHMLKDCREREHTVHLNVS